MMLAATMMPINVGPREDDVYATEGFAVGVVSGVGVVAGNKEGLSWVVGVGSLRAEEDEAIDVDCGDGELGTEGRIEVNESAGSRTITVW